MGREGDGGRAPRQRPDQRGSAIITRSLGFLERWRATARYERERERGACAATRCSSLVSPVTVWHRWRTWHVPNVLCVIVSATEAPAPPPSPPRPHPPSCWRPPRELLAPKAFPSVHTPLRLLLLLVAFASDARCADEENNDGGKVDE